MTGFLLEVGGLKPAVCIVAAHGLTDLNSFSCLPTYAASVLMPLPSTAVTAVFCSASFVHLRNDIGGTLTTLLVHASALLVAVRSSSHAAFRLMMVYLVFLHTPQHYVRVIRHSRRRPCSQRGLLAAAIATVWSLFFVTLDGRFYLTDMMQRVATAHILCTELQADGE